MRKIVPVVALAVAAAHSSGISAAEKDEKQEGEVQDAASRYWLPAAVVAGAAALAAFAGGRGGGGGGGGASAGPADPAGGNSNAAIPRTLVYTSAAAFDTAEYEAQAGLAWVKAASLYYNGHYRWFTGAAADAAAGTGIGIKIAVADTGINPREAATGAAIAIDAAASYDYVNDRPGAAADDFGHGTHVAGIIAAPKNGAGMHGLAFNATIVNFKVGNSTGSIVASDTQLADMMNRAARAGAMVINNSWMLAGSSITSFTAQDVQSSMPRMIEASRAYVAAGGVVVFAAGNDAGANPALQPGLPYRITGLQPGWLAVVAIDDTGRLAGYSNRCGVAAAWCLAAPGGSPENGIFSMYNNGGYQGMYGTSMAAPHAAAAVAALKSMFVNLSTLQIRDRLLFTANRSGAYADASTYGQGLMDLDAASSPVGGLSVPAGVSANGPTVPIAASAVVFNSGTVAALRLQPRVLVVDNYQRAPFWIPSASLFREATPRLVDRQRASLASAPSAKGIQAFSADFGAFRLGLAQGGGGEAALGERLDLVSVPRLASPGSDSMSLGLTTKSGAVRFGLVGTLPTADATEPRTLDASSLGGRRALGGVAQRGDARTAYGVSFAVADHFERPIGIASSGAFGVGNGGATSVGAFARQAVGKASTLEASFEIAHHQPDASLALAAPPFELRAASLMARTPLGAKTTFSAAFKREWARGEAARLELPTTIAEDGSIGRVSYRLPYEDLLGRTTLDFRVDHALTKRVALRAGFTQERYGFGVSITGVSALLEITQ